MVEFSIEQLDKIMQNMGNQQFDYESFKAAYDSDPRIQEIVKDFNQDMISLKTREMDDIKTTKNKGKNTVKTMAKRAVDLKDL